MQSTHEQLHQKAMKIAAEYLKYESLLIEVLQELNSKKTFLHYGERSLFAYAVNRLKLSESVALTLIGIARKSDEVPELKHALANQMITVTNARRIVPVLTKKNKEEWIAKAASLPQAKLEKELAIHFPDKVSEPTRLKRKSETRARIEADVSTKALDLLKRAQEILSQKNQEHVDVSKSLELVLEDFIERHDPLKIAERAVIRKEKAGQTSNTPVKQSPVVRPVNRVTIPAALKHQITLRDSAQCTYKNANGTRCQQKQWLDVHHLLPVSLGGVNEPENLTTLCSSHHKITHMKESAA